MSSNYYALPRTYSAQALNLLPDAVCVLCGAGETDISIQREWVLCPLADNRPTCVGCCFDYQDLARAFDFESDVYRGLFDELALQSGRSVKELRLLCLHHQQEIIGEQLSDPTTADKEELLSLAGEISLIAGRVKP